MRHIVRYLWTREYAFLFRRKPSRAFFVGVYPFVILGFLLLIFSGKVLTRVPIAVADQSRGVYSRELIRNLSANQFLAVYEVPSVTQAFQMLEQGQVYSVVAVDKEYDKNLLKYSGAQLSAWINNEYLLIGGNVTKGLNNVVSGLNTLYARAYIAAPLRVSETVLYNPAFNYVHFLGLGLLPAVLQLFICLSVCYSLLWDVKTRHARRLQYAFTTHPYIAAGSKIGFYIIAYVTVILVMLGIFIFGFGVPVQGNFLRVLLGVIAFSFLTAGAALSIAAMTNSLRLALSICAMYAAPAFAYYGVSFPVQSMPVLARLWAEFMPGTHLNRIFVNELVRGVNTAGTWGEIGVMLGLGMVLFILGTRGYIRWIKQDKYWGPQL